MSRIFRYTKNSIFDSPYRRIHTSSICQEFHFDTHHFVQRLEREGLNRAQAEGMMSAMAEVIDESIRNMTSNMVTKSDQEKVCFLLRTYQVPKAERYHLAASLHPKGRFCPVEVRTTVDGEERSCHDEGRE